MPLAGEIPPVPSADGRCLRIQNPSRGGGTGSDPVGGTLIKTPGVVGETPGSFGARAFSGLDHECRLMVFFPAETRPYRAVVPGLCPPRRGAERVSKGEPLWTALWLSNAGAELASRAPGDEEKASGSGSASRSETVVHLRRPGHPRRRGEGRLEGERNPAACEPSESANWQRRNPRDSRPDEFPAPSGANPI